MDEPLPNPEPIEPMLPQEEPMMAPPPPPPPPPLEPVAKAARIAEMDIVRGIAILGVFLINMPLFILNSEVEVVAVID